MTDISKDKDALRNIAVGGLAVETLSGEVWADMAKWVHERKEQGMEYMQKVAKEMETAFKKDYDLGSMPSAYRSAKAVAFGAHREGIALLDERGNVYGKSDIEDQIKVSRIATNAMSGKSKPTKHGSHLSLIELAKELHARVVFGGEKCDISEKAKLINLLNDVMKALP